MNLITRLLLLTISLTVLSAPRAAAQIVNIEPEAPVTSKTNTNIKFQISIAQRLTKSTLPLGTYLFLFYSQKCFWNVLENSMPMTDLNFNPGIGLTKPLFVRNRFVGKVNLILEHESNGRDGTASSTWNRV